MSVVVLSAEQVEKVQEFLGDPLVGVTLPSLTEDQEDYLRKLYAVQPYDNRVVIVGGSDS